MLSDAQRRFLALHQRSLVTQWRNILGGSHLRATTDRGRSATLAVGELEQLFALGLITSAEGYALALTEAGKQIA